MTVKKNNTVLSVQNLSKQYRLGLVGTGTLSHDLNRWWHKIRGLSDPYLVLGEVNDRTTRGGDYVWAVRNISFEVEEGEVLGIIGKNGAGKSTLLKLLSQITSPSEGHIKIKGRVASLLEVGTGFHPELTGKENIYLNGAILGMTKAEIRNKMDEIIDFSGCAKYIDTPVKRYSSGMMVRLGFAVAAHLEPEILVVDEVLAVGDAEFQKKCIGKMKEVSKSGRTVIFVSHNMASVKELCSRALILEKGGLSFSGDVVTAVNSYISSNLGREGDLTSSNPVIESRELKFLNLSLLNSESKKSNVIFYKENFKLLIELESLADYRFAVVDVSIGTEVEKILYISSYDFYCGFIQLDSGTSLMQIDFPNNLLPGVYFVHLGCHIHNGGGISTMAMLDYCLKFEVMKTTRSGTGNYPFQLNFGHSFSNANWEIKKK